MASAAEQLARNLSFSTFSKAKDLQKRIFFTLGALLVYRLGTYIPIPGIDPDAFAATFQQAQGGIFGWVTASRRILEALAIAHASAAAHDKESES